MLELANDKFALRAELERQVDALRRREQPPPTESSLERHAAALLAFVDPTPRPPFESHRVDGPRKRIVLFAKSTISRVLRPMTAALLQRQTEFNLRAQRLLQAAASEAHSLATALRYTTERDHQRHEDMRREREQQQQSAAKLEACATALRETSQRLAVVEEKLNARDLRVV